MYKEIHVSSLTKFLSCPHKFRYDTEPKDIVEQTYKGDVLNIAVLSDGPYDKYIDWYAKNYPIDFKTTEIVKKACAEAREYVNGIKKDNFLYQESKHYLFRGDYTIVGSLDLHYMPREGEEVHYVEDLKLSTHKHYMSAKLMEYDCQSWLYPLMIMNYRNVDVVEFSFVCRDKKSGKMKKNTVVRLREDCEAFLDHVMTKYMECEFTGKRPEYKNDFCFMKCPLSAGCTAKFSNK